MNRSFPSEISELWIKLDNISLSSHPGKRMLNMNIIKFRKGLQQLYNSWFPNAKSITSSQLGEYLFMRGFQRSQAKTIFKVRFNGLIGTTERLRKSIYLRWSKEGFNNRVLDEVILLKEVAFEALPFLDEAEFWVKGVNNYSGVGKSNVLFSTEIFESSKMMLREAHYKSTMGDFAMRPTSIFLIRQAIEIRLKNALGIGTVRRPDGRIIPLPFPRIVALINRGKSAILLPIPLITIKRIYSWANFYIHTAWMPYIWEMECAQYLLTPLFIGKKRKDGSWSRFGTVRLKKSLYNSIPKLLQDLLKKEEPKIIVNRFQNPECVFI